MKTKLTLLILGLGLVFTLSCSKYPPSSDRLLEDLAVFTQYDTKVDFNNYKTYSISPTIKKITDKDTTELTGQTAEAVLSQIDLNMKARGFVQSATGVIPDFGIQVLYFQNTNINAYYYDYWGYYPYWGYYYPYYPVYYTSYTTGTANIELIDMKVVDPTNKRLSLRWNAFIRGLLTGYHTTAEITSRVDQAFIQTPQLKTTSK
jgi:hypothetical protein